MKIRALKAIVFLTWLGIVANPAGAIALRCQEGDRGRERANQAIKRLWSPDQSVRDSAKGALLNLGPDAVQPLLSFFEDLATNDRERYELEMDVAAACGILVTRICCKE